MFDDRYFFSFEDLDWCLRARRQGFTSVVTADARVYHQGSASMGESPERLYHAARNHLRLAQSVSPTGRGGVFRTAAVVSFNLAHAVQARGGTLGARLGAVARGIRDHLRS